MGKDVAAYMGVLQLLQAENGDQSPYNQEKYSLKKVSRIS